MREPKQITGKNKDGSIHTYIQPRWCMAPTWEHSLGYCWGLATYQDMGKEWSEGNCKDCDEYMDLSIQLQQDEFLRDLLSMAENGLLREGF